MRKQKKKGTFIKTVLSPVPLPYHPTWDDTPSRDGEENHRPFDPTISSDEAFKSFILLCSLH